MMTVGDSTAIPSFLPLPQLPCVHKLQIGLHPTITCGNKVLVQERVIFISTCWDCIDPDNLCLTLFLFTFYCLSNFLADFDWLLPESNTLRWIKLPPMDTFICLAFYSLPFAIHIFSCERTSPALPHFSSHNLITCLYLCLYQM